MKLFEIELIERKTKRQFEKLKNIILLYSQDDYISRKYERTEAEQKEGSSGFLTFPRD